jgi:hypothetical protein
MYASSAFAFLPRARRTAAFVLSVVVVSGGCGSPSLPESTAGPTAAAADTADLNARIGRFAPVEIAADISALQPGDVEALAEMLRAAEIMDGLFLEQVWSGNTGTMVKLASDRTPRGQAELHYFLINKGPWSRLDDDEPFLQSQVPAKPPQANFYPADSTQEEVEKWFGSLGGATRTLATGFFSVIRRGADGRLMAVPYNVQYRNALVDAAAHLQRAATLATNETLKKYLQLRAGAFLSNDYYDSDIAWMELDASIEPTIGPYETYEDAWFGYKAAFEAFVTLRDDAETNKLGAFSSELQGLENALPIDARYRNPKIGALAPIRVVNVVFTAGDANRGVQTAAFNLPNDDRVISEKGSKRVMLKNVQDAKFQRVLTPIANVAIAAGDRSRVAFDAFFTHILMHELMHGLGPQQVHGSTTSVREALKETYAPLEEAKADISGLWALQQLADKGTISADVARSMYVTFLASSFRSIRFGLRSAHARGQTLQLNYLLDKGAVVVNADGTFGVVDDKIKQAVADLTRDLMTLQAVGDYAAATEMLKTMVVVRREVQRVLDQLKDVPVDIEPNFVSVNVR